jgi:hypothetical protein
MVNNDTDSNLMLPRTIFWITWAILVFFYSFLCPFVFPYFSLDAQCCYFCLANPFHIYLLHSIHCFEPDLTPNMFKTSFLFATPPLKHSNASYTPNLSVSSLTKKFGYPCPNNIVHMSLRLVSFPMKTFLLSIYTRYIPEHWFHCIHNSSW